MPTNKSPLEGAKDLRRLATLRERLGGFDLVCSGTLQRRRMVCGKAVCRCQKDPAARHGPYVYWGRRVEGRLVQKLLTPAQVKIVRGAIRNHRAILRILRQWEDQTVKIIDSQRRVQG